MHPVAQANGLLGLDAGVLVDALLAALDKLGNTVGLDVALALEAKLALDFHFDPEALAVEAVLVPLVETAHGPVPLVGVFVGAAPGVVDTHGVVGGDGAVHERPARAALVLGDELVERLGIPPERQDALFHRRIRYGARHWSKSHSSLLLLLAPLWPPRNAGGRHVPPLCVASGED